MNQDLSDPQLPAAHLKSNQMPGHWLLARLGKRVLRPGGLEATYNMLDALNIRQVDDVVEFAPGLGVTARLTLQQQPKSYTAIERDLQAQRLVQRYLRGERQVCLHASADQTGLPGASASVIYGEAMLSMQSREQKMAIIGEASRVLRAGGRYAIHELCFVPEALPTEQRREIEQDLLLSIHVGARPLLLREWEDIFLTNGLKPVFRETYPMHLLEPARMIRDEGIRRALYIAFNVLRDREARKRVLHMRRIFRKHAAHLNAVVLVGQKVG
jgi:phospholipid N-methyltransferase